MVLLKGQLSVDIVQWSLCPTMSFKGQFTVVIGHWSL
jgi:hypothetical protein